MIQSKKVIALLLGASCMFTTASYGMLFSKNPKKMFKSPKSPSASQSNYKKLLDSDYHGNSDEKNIDQPRNDFAKAIGERYREITDVHIKKPYYEQLNAQHLKLKKTLAADDILHVNDWDGFDTFLDLYSFVDSITKKHKITNFLIYDILNENNEQQVLFLFANTEEKDPEMLKKLAFATLESSWFDIAFFFGEKKGKVVCYKHKIDQDQAIFKLMLQKDF